MPDDNGTQRPGFCHRDSRPDVRRSPADPAQLRTMGTGHPQAIERWNETLFESRRRADSADIAMDLTQNEVSSKLAEIESRELGRIERAIEKLKDGSFGSCENCNRKIPMARLNALPYTTTCVSCQRLSEQYGSGDSEHQEDWQRVYDNEPRSDNVKLSDIEFGLSKNGS